MLKNGMAEMRPISQFDAPKASANAARNGPTKKAFIAVVQIPSKIIGWVLVEGTAIYLPQFLGKPTEFLRDSSETLLLPSSHLCEDNLQISE